MPSGSTGGRWALSWSAGAVWLVQLWVSIRQAMDVWCMPGAPPPHFSALFSVPDPLGMVEASPGFGIHGKLV